MLKIKRRGKKGTWYIVGTCPVTGGRIRQSTGLVEQGRAEAERIKLETRLLDERTYGKRATAVFAEAVELYAQKGGSPRFIEPLVRHFGLTRLADITDAEVSKFAALAYPNTKPQTIDRQVYGPLIAIWRVACKAKMCGPHEFVRPRHPEKQAVEYIRDEDLAKLLPVCNPRLKAAVLLLSFTAVRASELCRVRPEDVDWQARTLLLRKTKPGVPRTVPLAPVVLEAMLALRNSESNSQELKSFFGYAQRFSLNQAIARACRRAGLPEMTSHQIGRHAFAARLLRQRRTLKEVQEAGGWSVASMSMLARTYAHLEKTTVEAVVRGADTDLAQLMRKSLKKLA